MQISTLPLRGISDYVSFGALSLGLMLATTGYLQLASKIPLLLGSFGGGLIDVLGKATYKKYTTLSEISSATEARKSLDPRD